MPTCLGRLKLCYTIPLLFNQHTYLPSCWEFLLLTVYNSPLSLYLGLIFIQKLFPWPWTRTDLHPQPHQSNCHLYSLLLQDPVIPTIIRKPSSLTALPTNSSGPQGRELLCPSHQNTLNCFGEWSVFWAILQEHSQLAFCFFFSPFVVHSQQHAHFLWAFLSSTMAMLGFLVWSTDTSMTCNHFRLTLWKKRGDSGQMAQRLTDPILQLYHPETAGLITTKESFEKVSLPPS